MTLPLTRRLIISGRNSSTLYRGIDVIAFRLNLHHFITTSDNRNEKKMRRKVKSVMRQRNLHFM